MELHLTVTELHLDDEACSTSCRELQLVERSSSETGSETDTVETIGEDAGSLAATDSTETIGEEANSFMATPFPAEPLPVVPFAGAQIIPAEFRGPIRRVVRALWDQPLVRSSPLKSSHMLPP